MYFIKYLLNHTENWTLHISTFRQLTRDTRGVHKLSWTSEEVNLYFVWRSGSVRRALSRKENLHQKLKESITIRQMCLLSAGGKGEKEGRTTVLPNCVGAIAGDVNRPLRCSVPAYMATCNKLEGGTFQAKKYKRKTKWLKNVQYQIKPWVEGVWLLNNVYRDAQENI